MRRGHRIGEGHEGGLKPCEPWFGKDRMELVGTLGRGSRNCRRGVRDTCVTCTNEPNARMRRGGARQGVAAAKMVRHILAMRMVGEGCGGFRGYEDPLIWR